LQSDWLQVDELAAPGHRRDGAGDLAISHKLPEQRRGIL
jgi:hypothetical protein